MELDKFVAKTLTMISRGVQEAQNECEQYGVIVNDSPNTLAREQGMYGSNNDALIQKVEFDIAITTEDSTNGEGKISVLGIKGGVNNKSKDTYSSRVKFSIPITFSINS